MTLTEKVREDMTAAMKARDTLRLSTLRMLQAALKNEQIAKGRELTDPEALEIVLRSVKQRQDSIEQFEKGGRMDLVEKEQAELAILESYTPQQLTELETEKLVQDVVEMTGAETRKDVGKVMKEIMATHRGRIDGKKVSEILNRLLP